jgi:hypothetical protein
MNRCQVSERYNPPMEHWTDLLRAIATLLWPLVVIAALWRFHRELATLLTRPMRFKLPGGIEAETGQQLRELGRTVPEAQADAAEEAEEQQAATRSIVPPIRRSSEASGESDVIRRILDEAAENPKLGLISLAIEIEREVRAVLASRGVETSGRDRGVHGGIAALQQQGALPPSIASSVRIFWNVRNQLIHGIEEASLDELVRTIDLGLDILRALYAIPREVHTVIHADVPIYEDAECTKARADANGVILESVSSSGLVTSVRIFPTRRTYRPGARVSWEWDDRTKWAESWYKDPETKQPTYAWTASIEFAGRVLSEP